MKATITDPMQGKIRNREYAKQLRDFSGLCFGKISPTDIDGFLDFGGKAFVFIETKHGGAMPPFGQKLALERVCDACQRSGVETLLIVASHDTAEDVDVGSLPVIAHRYKEKWKKPKQQTSVRQYVDQFLNFCTSA